MRIEADDTRAAIAARATQAAGRLSRLWGQRGLGTILATLGRIPGLGRMPGAAGGRVRVEFEPGCTFEIDPLEPYWGPTVIGRRAYEPELRCVLERLAPFDPVFVDCGANFGYWSVVASGPRLRISRVLAIEPNPSTFARLSRNASLNDGRFRCLEMAVTDRSGDHIVLAEMESHAVAHLSRDPSATGHAVVTTRIDDAVRSAGWSPSESYFMKLDVEGHEIEAITSAGTLADLDCVFVVEDFSKRDYPLLRRFDFGAWEVFYPHGDGRLTAMSSLDALNAIVVSEGRTLITQNVVLTRGRGKLVDAVRRWAGVTAPRRP